MGWEALGLWFESSTVAFLFLLFFSYFFFFLWKLRQSLLLETTILSVRTPVTTILSVKTPGTAILS